MWMLSTTQYEEQQTFQLLLSRDYVAASKLKLIKAVNSAVGLTSPSCHYVLLAGLGSKTLSIRGIMQLTAYILPT